MAFSCRAFAVAACGRQWVRSRAVYNSVWRDGRQGQTQEGERQVPHIPYMEVHPKVSEAIALGHPVIAMETTIVTHGMPYPDNLRTAVEVEDLVKSLGVVPATIGILDGKVHVGLTRAQLERLADSADTFKVSRRDLAYVLSQGYCGGTTVSATMLCAHKAGIEVFVTGGIGGVHREGENTLDISADLVELGRTPVAVVCAGVKSILDIGRTLEVLETHGVTVVTYGPSKQFPAFFTPKSGHQAPFNVETPLQCAKLIESNRSFGVGSGLLIAVPIPPDVGCLGDEIEQAIQQALTEAKNAGIMGKAVTPFVLQRVNELTAGKSLQANVALVRNNARVGACIAVELSTLRYSGHMTGGGQTHQAMTGRGQTHQAVTGGGQTHQAVTGGGQTHQAVTGGGQTHQAVTGGGQTHQAVTGGRQTHQTIKIEEQRCKGDKQVVVVGGSILDFTAKVRSPQVESEGTNLGSLMQSFGGVARNVAECLARLGTPPFFISAVGDDINGQRIMENLQECGVSLAGVGQLQDTPTATYCVVLDGSGETYCAVGDMDIMQSISPEWVRRFSEVLEGAPMVCVDANVPETTVQLVCDVCWKAGVPVWYEPTCLKKAAKAITVGCHSQLLYASPSLSELRSMVAALTASEVPDKTTPGLSVHKKLNECHQLCPPLLSHIPNILVSLGKDGLVHAQRRERHWEGGGIEMKLFHYPPAASNLLPVGVVNVTGAGDSFVGGMISALVQGLDQDLAIKAGLRAAYLSILSQTAVPRNLAPELFTEDSIRKWAPWCATALY